MAFEFNSDSQEQLPKVTPPKERFGRFNLIMTCLLGTTVLGWLAWTPVTSAVKSHLAQSHASQARQAAESKDFQTAFDHIIKARRWGGDSVDVIRATIAVLQKTNDHSTLTQQLRLLSEKVVLTAEEETLLAKSFIATGSTAEARKVYEKIPLGRTSTPASLDLLSRLLQAEGHPAEAAEISRRSLQKQSDSPEARFQLAAEDLGNPSFPEIRRHARFELWALAKDSNETALSAIALLAMQPDLTSAEAHQLLLMEEKHPHSSLGGRLQILSAIIRLEPATKEKILDAETQRFQAGAHGSLPVFAAWLAQEKQHARLVRLVPQDIVNTSRELYPILADALAAEGRWEELEKMLKVGHPPVSRELADVWRAEVQSHTRPDLKETRLLLQGTIAAAAKKKNAAALLAAAVLAEKLSLRDLELAACQAVGGLGGEAAMPFLRRAGELAQQEKDTVSLLDISRQLHTLKPGSAAYRDQLTYLRLVLGVEFESVDFTDLESTDEVREAMTIRVERIPPQLLRALQAYRLGDQQHLKLETDRLPDIARLPAGQRAVAAGLLSLAGNPARAYEIAEKVPAAMLLNEENAFLNRAK